MARRVHPWSSQRLKGLGSFCSRSAQHLPSRVVLDGQRPKMSWVITLLKLCWMWIYTKSYICWESCITSGKRPHKLNTDQGKRTCIFSQLMRLQEFSQERWKHSANRSAKCRQWVQDLSVLKVKNQQNSSWRNMKKDHISNVHSS